MSERGFVFDDRHVEFTSDKIEKNHAGSRKTLSERVKP